MTTIFTNPASSPEEFTARLDSIEEIVNSPDNLLLNENLEATKKWDFRWVVRLIVSRPLCYLFCRDPFSDVRMNSVAQKLEEYLRVNQHHYSGSTNALRERINAISDRIITPLKERTHNQYQSNAILDHVLKEPNEELVRLERAEENTAQRTTWSTELTRLQQAFQTLQTSWQTEQTQRQGAWATEQGQRREAFGTEQAAWGTERTQRQRDWQTEQEHRRGAFETEQTAWGAERAQRQGAFGAEQETWATELARLQGVFQNLQNAWQEELARRQREPGAQQPQPQQEVAPQPQQDTWRLELDELGKALARSQDSQTEMFERGQMALNERLDGFGGRQTKYSRALGDLTKDLTALKKSFQKTGVAVAQGGATVGNLDPQSSQQLQAQIDELKTLYCGLQGLVQALNNLRDSRLIRDSNVVSCTDSDLVDAILNGATAALEGGIRGAEAIIEGHGGGESSSSGETTIVEGKGKEEELPASPPQSSSSSSSSSQSQSSSS